MHIPETVQAEWHERQTLTRQALRLIPEFADPGDYHPIATAVDQIRATEVLLDER